MNNNFSQYDFKKSIKRGCIYLLIAVPFMLIISVVLNIVGAPFWLNILSTVVVGGIVVFVAYVISTKIAEKKKENEKNKYDPFKD